jgi:hypothetical protein
MLDMPYEWKVRVEDETKITLGIFNHVAVRAAISFRCRYVSLLSK